MRFFIRYKNVHIKVIKKSFSLFATLINVLVFLQLKSYFKSFLFVIH